MAGKVSVDSRPHFDSDGHFFLTVWLIEGDVREGDWVRLPGWKTPFVRYRIQGAHRMSVMDLFKPTDNMRGLQIAGVSSVQGHWLGQRIKPKLMLEIDDPLDAFEAPAQSDAPRLLPRWLVAVARARHLTGA